MGLTPDQIKAIYEAKQAKKKAPASNKAAQGGRTESFIDEKGVARYSKGLKMIRQKTHYSHHPKNHLVKLHDGGTLRCESFGCGCPAYHLYLGTHPLCQLHLIHMLLHEINMLSSYGKIRTQFLNERELELVAQHFDQSEGFPESVVVAATSPADDGNPSESAITTGDTSPIGEAVSDNNGYL